MYYVLGILDGIGHLLEKVKLGSHCSINVCFMCTAAHVFKLHQATPPPQEEYFFF